MANQIKGETPLVVGSETFRLVLDANALCEAEGLTTLKTSQIIREIPSGDFRLIRNMLWIGLRRFHDDVTVDDAGDILTELGPGAAVAVIVTAINNAFPASPKEGGKPRPRQRQGRATATA